MKTNKHYAIIDDMTQTVKVYKQKGKNVQLIFSNKTKALDVAEGLIEDGHSVTVKEFILKNKA